jgi:hypothetical protein
MLASLLRAFAGLEAGRSCRSCHEPIHPSDEFGMSESVCQPCRA